MFVIIAYLRLVIIFLGTLTLYLVQLQNVRRQIIWILYYKVDQLIFCKEYEKWLLPPRNNQQTLSLAK